MGVAPTRCYWHYMTPEVDSPAYAHAKICQKNMAAVIQHAWQGRAGSLLGQLIDHQQVLWEPHSGSICSQLQLQHILHADFSAKSTPTSGRIGNLWHPPGGWYLQPKLGESAVKPLSQADLLVALRQTQGKGDCQRGTAGKCHGHSRFVTLSALCWFMLQL